MTDDAREVADLPPNDVEAESLTIGAVVTDGHDGRVDAARAAMGLVTVGDFYLGAHRAIWDAVERMVAEGLAPEAPLLRRRIEAAGLYDEKVADAFVVAVTSNANAGNAAVYAAIVADKAAARRFVVALSDARAAVYRNGVPVAEAARRHIEEVTARVLAGANDPKKRDPVPIADVAVASTDPDADWVWEGLLAKGAVTILAGQSKAGKSYFVAALIRAAERGGMFLNRRVTPTRALLLSEEHTATIAKKRERFGWESLHVRPRSHAFPRRPFGAVVAEAVADAARLDVGLLVIDTWAHWAGLPPDAEKDAGATQAALAPLLEASTRGLAVLIVHHLRKSDGDGPDVIRGSTALAAGVDVILTYRRAKGGTDRRAIHGEGRWESSAFDSVVELDGDTFRALGEASKVAVDDLAARVVAFLATHPWTTADLLQDALSVQRARLRAVLAEAVAAGALDRVGDGTRSVPYKYATFGTTRPS